MDRGAWWAAVHGVSRSRTRLSDFTFTFHFHALEKEMATHSRILAWRIPMDRGAWWATVHGGMRSRTRLSDFTFTFHFHALEKEMTTHSSVLAWRIPGMGEAGGLLSMGSHRVGHDWSDLAAAAAHNKWGFPGGVSHREVSESCSVVSTSLWPHGLYSPWNSSGQIH